MTNREFVLWLWGFLELCHPQVITCKMLFIIRNHMHLVLAVDGQFGEFNKIIYARISEALDSGDVVEDTTLFDSLKRLVCARLIEIENSSQECA